MMHASGAGLTAGVTEDIDIFGDYYQNTDYKNDRRHGQQASHSATTT